MYVDFYLEDDMFEIEGQFFTIDGQLYIEVHDSVMHILEMAGKELRVGQVGELSPPPDRIITVLHGNQPGLLSDGKSGSG